MEGLLSFVSIVVIVFGILQIILFFKIWGMTGNVTKIMQVIVKIREPKPDVDWEREFFTFIASKKIEDARYLLYKRIIWSLEFRNIVVSNNETYKAGEIEKLNKKYSDFLQAIGEDRINIDYENQICKTMKF